MSRGSENIAAIAVLSDALRRRLYEFIRRQPRPVTRDEAAEHAGISRRLAAFHLDKLARTGLLRSHYAPPDGSDGAARRPGRRPKLYEPTETEFAVSVPQRHYDLVGEILVVALASEPDHDQRCAGRARDVATEVAAARGERVGAAARREARLHRPGPERALTATAEVLTTLGYEPHRESPALLCLRNCPFHRLAEQAPDLVCGLNHAFVAGVLRGLDARSVEAVKHPGPQRCCVEVRQAAN